MQFIFIDYVIPKLINHTLRDFFYVLIVLPMLHTPGQKFIEFFRYAVKPTVSRKFWYLLN